MKAWQVGIIALFVPNCGPPQQLRTDEVREAFLKEFSSSSPGTAIWRDVVSAADFDPTELRVVSMAFIIRGDVVMCNVKWIGPATKPSQTLRFASPDGSNVIESAIELEPSLNELPLLVRMHAGGGYAFFSSDEFAMLRNMEELYVRVDDGIAVLAEVSKAAPEQAGVVYKVFAFPFRDAPFP